MRIGSFTLVWQWDDISHPSWRLHALLAKEMHERIASDLMGTGKHSHEKDEKRQDKAEASPTDIELHEQFSAPATSEVLI